MTVMIIMKKALYSFTVARPGHVVSFKMTDATSEFYDRSYICFKTNGFDIVTSIKTSIPMCDNYHNFKNYELTDVPSATIIDEFICYPVPKLDEEGLKAMANPNVRSQINIKMKDGDYEITDCFLGTLV